MSPLPVYSFLPWTRHGLANTITAADEDHTIATRANTHVELKVAGNPVAGGAELTDTVARNVALYGPGDILGIDPRAIVRTEPRDWITNFESNYLAAIDFYDEDFPWRYTPAAPGDDDLHLRPWIALVVLAESEFTDGANLAGHPLPYITIADPSVLPAPGDLWAWAHVHVNSPLTAASEPVSHDTAQVLHEFEQTIASNRDNAYSRLMCPRQLQDDTAYHAFLIPTFETGRLAGLGLEPGAAPYATASAWEEYPQRAQGSEFPYYYRWSFRTGSYGDFEYLVRLLQPQPVDARVGIRDIDVTDPGSNLPGIDDPALGGVLRLGGALQVPEADLNESQIKERETFENWDEPYPAPFQRSLAAFVNLADGYEAQTAGEANAASGIGAAVEEDPDPLVTAPLYARWQALTQRLLTERDGSPVAHESNWVHNVNLDPRFRVPAGFGAQVVETNDETYMSYAWQQIGEVLRANYAIRRMQLAVGVSARWYDRHLTTLASAQPERAFGLTSPVQSKIIADTSTIASQRTGSLLPPSLTSPAMRRVLRPHGRLMRGLQFTATATPGNLLQRIDAGEVSAAPPVTVPAGVTTITQVAQAVAPQPSSGSLLATLSALAWLPWALLALGLVLLLLAALLLPAPAGILLGIALFAALAWLAWMLSHWKATQAPTVPIAESAQTPSAVSKLPQNPTFTLSEPTSPHTTPPGASDSPTAVRFKHALEDSFALIQASASVGRRPTPTAVDLTGLGASALKALEPTRTIPARVFSTIQLPEWISGELREDYGEVMAYPRIDLPMYQPLKAISVELFLPNINLVAPNSVTLVETNQRFIESYMIGLNHEFARKLLWREYPTDQRGSYFRQFWDVRSTINTEGLSESAQREALYDIPPLNEWQRASKLGEHNNRQPPGEHGEQAVLVIRGELLKKYPTAVIYAQRAEWEYQADGKTPDLTKPRKLVPLTEAEELKPPQEKLRLPLYDAKADPDIYFFGFDLTIAEAKGGSGHPPQTDPGWFFVIRERPGEPRFGLELTREPKLELLEELTWQDALPGGKPGQFLSAESLKALTLVEPPAPDVEYKKPQYLEDLVADAAPASAARWAYLLLRVPVMVAVHADQMLGSGA